MSARVASAADTSTYDHRGFVGSSGMTIDSGASKEPSGCWWNCQNMTRSGMRTMVHWRMANPRRGSRAVSGAMADDAAPPVRPEFEVKPGEIFGKIGRASCRERV